MGAIGGVAAPHSCSQSDHRRRGTRGGSTSCSSTPRGPPSTTVRGRGSHSRGSPRAGPPAGSSILFRPDKSVFISLGDGGGDAGKANVRNTTCMLGGIIRINLTATTLATPYVARARGRCLVLKRPRSYSVPSDNPFVGNSSYTPEIWAKGFRNPWCVACPEPRTRAALKLRRRRCFYDAPVDRLWCGDVGENNWEELDIVVKGAYAARARAPDGVA